VTATKKILETQQIQIMNATHAIGAYGASPAENTGGVVHGIPLDATDEFIKENLRVQNRTTLVSHQLDNIKTYPRHRGGNVPPE
ncbi:hypothetical protein HPB47_008761, partial [Ixodes persulcatus]